MKKKAVKGSLGAIALASAMTMSMGTQVFAIQGPPRPDGTIPGFLLRLFFPQHIPAWCQKASALQPGM